MMSVDGSSQAAIILSLNAWNIDATQDTIDVTSFGDTNRVYVVGLPDLNGSFGGFWDDSETKIFAAARSTDGCRVYLYPDFANNPGSYFYGPAWVDSSINTGVGDAVTITANFRANGAWGQVGI
jgi:hypothetical protein